MLIVTCVKQVPDEVILLIDRAFGGTDTPATSMVLAEAIKQIKNIMDDNDKYDNV